MERYKLGTGDRSHIIETDDGKLLGGCSTPSTAFVICGVLNRHADLVAFLGQKADGNGLIQVHLKDIAKFA